MNSALKKQKRWCVEHCSDDARVAAMAAEKDILCVLVLNVRRLMKTV